ncbi:Conserved_hypothetical protein [Hexamita inflata]|uniref:Uncharacterized protein n=1 Tax=Hexamita inflata TaxID=28002 RepID=A0AA86QRU4_9EUKA|nr:Conserved hypothetical protein [Hexamita inflata]
MSQIDNIELSLHIFEIQNFTFTFNSNFNFETRYTERLNTQITSYYDLGYNFTLQQQDPIYKYDRLKQDMSTYDKINFNFQCDLVSKDPSHTVSHYNYKQCSDSIRNHKMLFTNGPFDYVCSIVSDESGFYLEVLNIEAEEIQCYQARFHQSNKNRTTLFAILWALQIVDPTSSVIFQLQNKIVLNYFNGPTISKTSLQNYDILQFIIQYNQVCLKFVQLIVIEERWSNRLLINEDNRYEKYFDIFNETNTKPFLSKCNDTYKIETHIEVKFNIGLNSLNNANQMTMIQYEVCKFNISQYIHKIRFTQSQPNYTCKIVSNNQGFYLEILNNQTAKIKCFKRCYYNSNMNRSTMFGVIFSLQFIQNNYNVLFILDNYQVYSELFRQLEKNQYYSNPDLLIQFLQYSKKFYLNFMFQKQFEQRFTERLVQETIKYYDIGYFNIDQIVSEQQLADYDMSNDKINFNFQCDLVSKDPSHTVSHYNYKQCSDSIRNHKMLFTNGPFDYVCSIVSDESGFYLEVLNIEAEEIQCYQARFHQSNKNRTTLFAILWALQIVDPTSSVIFRQTNRIIHDLMIEITLKKIPKANNYQIQDYDILMLIIKYTQVRFYFNCIDGFQKPYQQRFNQRINININNEQSQYFDLGYNSKLNTPRFFKIIFLQYHKITKTKTKIIKYCY